VEAQAEAQVEEGLQLLLTKTQRKFFTGEKSFGKRFFHERESFLYLIKGRERIAIEQIQFYLRKEISRITIKGF
jgi:hypothetical protein